MTPKQRSVTSRREHGRRDAEGDGPLPARRHAAPRESAVRAHVPRRSGLRQLVARPLQELRVRAPGQELAGYTFRALCSATTAATIVDEGGKRRDDRADVRISHFEKSTRYSDSRKRRSLTPRRSPGTSKPTMRSGGAAPALQRARAGGARLLHRAHHGPAELLRLLNIEHTRCSRARRVHGSRYEDAVLCSKQVFAEYWSKRGRA